MYTSKRTYYSYRNGLVYLTSSSQIPASVLQANYPGYTFAGTGVSNSVTLLVDINGSKGPNVNGRDVFWFTFYGGGNSSTTPEGVTTMNANNGKFVPQCSTNTMEDNKAACKESGSCCTSIIMANGWKIPDDYSFN